MTDEERRANLAAETEDISREDQIFLFGDEGESQKLEEQEIERVNEEFNKRLEELTEENMDNAILSVGRPSAVLRSVGIPERDIRLYGNKIFKKAKQHGYRPNDLRDLPNAVQNPIAVFAGSYDGSYSLLTTLNLNGRNALVSIDVLKGEVQDINIVTSVYGKRNDSVVSWINQGKMLYCDKERTLDYISSSAPIADATHSQEFSLATKIVKDFKNPSVGGENVSMSYVGNAEDYEKAQARDIYERRVKRGAYQTLEALLDSMLGLKEAMDAILKAEGKGKMHIEDVDGYENAYLGENRLSSVNQAEVEAFKSAVFDPLLKEVARLAGTESERNELTDYMMAKHGLERNEVMARRAAKKQADAEYGKEIRKAERAVTQDPLDQDAADHLDDLRQQRDDREEYLYFENRGRDYAGLTALTGEDNIAAAEAEAEQMVADYEAGHDTRDLWDKVRAVTQATLQKSHESGLISNETYDDIKNMYKHYIPLRGFDEKTSDEEYAYVETQRSSFNAPIKTAKGRKSKADAPFANMEAMGESAILQGNRNVLVKQKFLNFVLNHPSDLVSVSDVWLRYDDMAGEWTRVNPGDVQNTEALRSDDSAAEVERKMKDFEEVMKSLMASDPAKYKRQKDMPAVPYRVVNQQTLHEHQVLVKRNGRDYVLTINGNPRAAQALNGQTNPDIVARGWTRAADSVVGSVNRTLSMLYTTLQPDFVASNFMRDLLYANSMVWVKESPEYAVAFNKNYAKLPRVMSLLGKYRKGELDMNDKTEKMFYQFIMNGGETGFIRMADAETLKKKIQNKLESLSAKIPAGEVARQMGTWLGEVSRGIEMRARFAAFVTSRESGRSIDRSIWDAKEISVNFNKKGAGDAFLGTQGQTQLGNTAAFMSGAGRAVYIFWNAALQGTFGNFGKYTMRHKGKATTLMATSFGLGLLVAALAAGSEDEDNDYYDIPEHTRRQNLIVRGMGKTWIKIPLSIEYRAFYGMGELAGSTLFHGDELNAGKVMGQVSQLLPVDVMEGGSGLVPSGVKPAWDVYNNQTWYGSPIWKETPYNKNMPRWTKAYKSANPDLVNLAAVLNEQSGGYKYKKGAIDLNPAAVEYLLKQYTGGFFTVTNQLRNMASVVGGDKEFDWRYAPLLNRALMTGGDDRNAGRGLNDKFYEYMERQSAKDDELSQLRRDREMPSLRRAQLVDELYRDEDYQRGRMVEKAFTLLNKGKNMAEDAGDKEALEIYERAIRKAKKASVEYMDRKIDRLEYMKQMEEISKEASKALKKE